MRLRPLIQDIWDGARTHPSRAALSLISITLGMATLTLLLGIVGGLRDRTRATLRELGINVFGLVQAAPDADARTPPLTRGHVSLLNANLPGAIATGIGISDALPVNGESGIPVLATDEEVFRVRQWRLIAGRPFDRADLAAGARVTVLGATLANARGIRPGDHVRLGALPFRVIGLAELAAGAAGETQPDPAVVPGERAVLVPWTAAGVSGPGPRSPRQSVGAVFVRSLEPAAFAPTLFRTRALLAQPDRHVTNATWITPELMVQRLARLQRLIGLVGGAVVLLCIVLGGLTLTSLLLANLQTRIPEIGLRRALGALPHEIGALFLGEALLITTAGALGGLLAGVLLLGLTRGLFPLPVALTPAALAIPLLVGTGTGILAGYWPARLAARIAPAEALRND
jgi:ABC-type antimicrobial peptide transport system permease subunit